MAKQDFSELIEYLDKQFVINANEHKLIRAEFADLKNNFQELQTSVDAYAHKADTYFQEMVALSHKVDRMEKWLLQLAKKVGIKLEY